MRNHVHETAPLGELLRTVLDDLDDAGRDTRDPQVASRSATRERMHVVRRRRAHDPASAPTTCAVAGQRIAVDLGNEEENIVEIIQANVGKMETQLKQWGAKLDELVAKAEEAGTDARIDYRKSIDDLRSKHQVAQAKLDELKTAGTEKWVTFKIGIESAWNELEVAFKKLKN